MSIGVALNSALSGMQVAQASIGVTSDNIANVNTEGYVRKVANQSSRVVGTTGAGVDAEEITRVTDKFLSSELRIATSEAAKLEAKDLTFTQLTGLLGDPTTKNTLVGNLTEVFNKIGSVANNPEQPATRQALVEQLKFFGNELENLNTSLSSLQRQTDQQIDENINQLNDLLEEYHTVNKQIIASNQAGGTAGLDQQRDELIDKISQLVDVRTFELDAGGLALVTNSGVTLVDQALRQLVHEDSGSVEAGQPFSPIQLNFIDNETGQSRLVKENLDDSLRGGAIGGQLEMRDQVIPDLAAEIGTFAGQVAQQLNKVHNQFTSVPPAATMVGRNTGLAATDAHNFTGIVTFHAFDANNNVATSATVDFGAIGGTVNDAINAINAGLGGQGTASLTNGVMTLSAAGAAQGIGIAQDSATPSDRAGQGFSEFFGLNDLVSTSIGPDFKTGMAGGDNHGFTGQISVSVVGPGNQRPASVTIDMGAIGGTMNDVVNALNTGLNGVATFALDGDGRLVSTNGANFADHSIQVTSDNTARGTTGLSFQDFFGLGARAEAKVAADFNVSAAVENNPLRISSAVIDPAGNPAVANGDNRGAIALQGIADQNFTIRASGNLPQVSVTLSEYGSEILGNVGQLAALNTQKAEDRTALKTELAARSASVSGVNLDEEFAQLIQFQQAFNASARMFSTTREMIDTLLQI